MSGCGVHWTRRGGDLQCEGCPDQHRENGMLWCLRYGNEAPDPSVKKS